MGRFLFILSLLNVVVNFDYQHDGAENHHGNTALNVSRESHIKREDTPWKWTASSERLGSWTEHKTERELSPRKHCSLLSDCTWCMTSGFKSPGSCLPHHCALCGQTVSPKRPAFPIRFCQGCVWSGRTVTNALNIFIRNRSEFYLQMLSLYPEEGPQQASLLIYGTVLCLSSYHNAFLISQ